ncbi:MAG: hypothetical protein DDT26_02054 [Dehalococcoidia bacterium]|nr:hypothetical protein [Chloroflexota bacterium]
MTTVETLFIGVDGERTVGSDQTRRQIATVRALSCDLETKSGERVAWLDVDNTEEPRTIFQAILHDRELRVDQNTYMADRPAFCVITAIDGRAVRLEYYEGHDALTQRFDLRSKDLWGKALPNFMDVDPQAYDPVKFLSEAFGIRIKGLDVMLDEIHKELQEEEEK